jgi:hypothetical protein
MPKVYLSKEEKENCRFCDFVRGELHRQDKLFSDLAYELNLPTPSVTNRINGKARWTLPEIVATLSYLGKSYEFGEDR